MKTTLIFPILLGALGGLGIGWYCGYNRPVAHNQRKILNEYQTVRDSLKLSDGEMAELGRKLPEFRESAKRQDEFAAAIALSVFQQMEAGRVDEAKSNLVKTVASYFRGHRHDGNTNLLARINRIAATNLAFSNAINRKVERD